MKKRLLSFLLVLVMVCTLLPVSAFAATNQDIIWDFLKSKGFSDAGAAGIMGNIQQESGYRPNNLQDTYESSLNMTDAQYTAAVDNGTYSRNSFVYDSAGYGLVQWTFYTRKAGLYDYAKNTCGTSIANITTQLNYMYSEMSASLKTAMKNATDVSAACVQFHNEYENSADTASMIQTRVNYAKAVYEKYVGSSADTTTPGKPVLLNMQSEYDSGSSVTLKWNATKNTTHYNVYLDEMDSSGTYVRVNAYHYAESGMKLPLNDGAYRVCLQSTNKDAGWAYTDGDWVSFTVGNVKDPGKPILLNMEDNYESGRSITLTWENTINTTHYNIYLDKVIDGEYERIDHTFYVNSGHQLNLDDGVYRILLQSTNKLFYTDDGSSWRYTNADWVCFEIGSHEHDYKYVFYEGAHPHCNCYRCSICGQIWKDESSHNYIASCLECHRPDQVELKGMNNQYYDNDKIVFSWDETENTTHYTLWIYAKNSKGEYEHLEHEFYVNSGVTRTLPVGEYRVSITATNSDYWEEDGSTWLYKEGKYEYFKVVEKHTHSYTTSVTAPTCTEQGYTTYTCECGDSYIADYVPALGHNYVDGKCTRCGEKDPTPDPVTNAGKIVVSDARARAGEEVTVSVSIEDNPGIMVMALGIDYDKSKLELIGYEDGIMTGWKVATNAVWIGSDDVTANGVILKLKFKVLEDVEDGDIQVSMLFTEGDIANHNEDIIMPGISNGTITVYSTVPGDVTGDGKVNALDLVRLQRYLSGEDVVIGGSCDITGDGKINALDLVRLQRYLSGEEVVVC